MIIDSSALVAIITDEPEAERMTRSIASAGTRLISAGNALEAGIVIEARLGEVGGRDLDLYLHKLGIEVVTFTPRQANLARKAYRQFGKGRHPAGLNFGDCIAYALARDTGEPLLFKGEDFSRTDVAAVEY
jgi:ribonuclease VapC